MILWTIQTEAAVRQLEKRGALSGDGRRLSLQEHRAAFRWMIGQMERRLGKPPSGSRYPVWAWKAWDGERSPCPDLRYRAHLPKGTRGARIKIDVPDERVLLSDFDRWHIVLANQYLADDHHDDEAAVRADRQIIEASWERIFELDRGDPAYFGAPSERSIQATLWSIKLEDVLALTWFTAR